MQDRLGSMEAISDVEQKTAGCIHSTVELVVQSVHAVKEVIATSGSAGVGAGLIEHDMA